jgi:hypothetical protein
MKAVLIRSRSNIEMSSYPGYKKTAEAVLQKTGHPTTVLRILSVLYNLEAVRRFSNAAQLLAVSGYSIATPLRPSTPTFLFMASYKWYSSLPGELVMNNK